MTRKIAGNIETIDWGTVDCVACASTPEPGLRNERATCARCGIPVFYSSVIPVDVPKVCETCALKLAGQNDPESTS